MAHKLQLLEVKWSEQSGMEMDNASHSKQWEGSESLGQNRAKPTSERGKTMEGRRRKEKTRGRGRNGKEDGERRSDRDVGRKERKRETK